MAAPTPNPLKQDLVERSDHAARARLSRIIRNSEAGWLFYAPGGTAYHLLTDEAARIEARGLRMIGKCNWLGRELGRLPGKALKLAMIFFALSIVIPIATDWPIEQDLLVGAFAATFLFAPFFALLHPFIAMVLRASIMLAWQRREAAMLRRQGRGTVAVAVETRHRRYNLFRILFTAALSLLVVRLAALWLLTPTQVRERGFDIEIACLAVMGITMIPAKLIDMTHLRRKWLD